MTKFGGIFVNRMKTVVSIHLTDNKNNNKNNAFSLVVLLVCWYLTDSMIFVRL